MRKLNMAILTVLLVFQTILSPLGLFGVTFASADTGDSGSGVSTSGLTFDFKYLDYNETKVSNSTEAEQITPKKGDKIKLRYEFFTDENTDFQFGQGFTFKLPDSFLVFDKAALSGTVKVGGVDYFEYETSDDKTVTVKALRYVEGGIKNGWFEFDATLDNFKNDNLNQTLVIPKYNSAESHSINLTFAPLGDSSTLNKQGIELTDRSKYSNLNLSSGKRYIEWAAWVNVGGENLTEFNFEDKWPVGDGKFVTGSLSIATTTVEKSLNGVRAVGNPVALTSLPTPTTVTDGFNFNLTISPASTKAYKVTYLTEVTRTPKTEVEKFTNEVKVLPKNSSTTLSEWKANAAVNLEYGTPLAKEALTGSTKYEGKWKVSYNYIGNNVKGKILKDSLGTSSLHEYVEGSIELYEIQADGTRTDVTATITPVHDETGNSITVTFPDVDSNNPYELEYTTKSKSEFITGNPSPIKNNVTVKTPGTPANQYDYEVSTEINAGYGVGRKDVSKVDYKDKIVEWTVDLNADQKTMTNVVIQDFLDGAAGELKLIPYATGDYFKSINGADPDTLSPTINTNGFTLNVGTLNTHLKFTYQTSFDVLEKYLAATGKGSYQNSIKFSWDGGGTTPGSFDETKTGSFYPLEVFKNNAIKNGSYNYSTQKFTWTVKANVNQNEINKIVDTLDGYQKFDTGSLKIYELQIAQNGAISRASKDPITSGYTPNFNGDVLTITFAPNTNKAYEIVYETTDSDSIIGTGAGNGKTAQTYKNNAEIFLDNMIKGKATEASVKVEVADDLLTKRGSTSPAKSTVNWTVDINKSNSNINGVTVKDALSSENTLVNQFYLVDSFKLVPFNYSATDGASLGTSPVAFTFTKQADGTFSGSNNLGTLTVAADKKSFTLVLEAGLTSYAYQLQYESFYDGPQNGNFKNDAKLSYTNATTNTPSATGAQSDVNADYIYNDSSAGADFVRTSLTLTKKGKNNDDTSKTTNLEGVEFTVWNKTGEFQIDDNTYTTAADGTVKINSIGTGTYVIKEKLPAGYVAPTATGNGVTKIETKTENGTTYVWYTVKVADFPGTTTGTGKTWTVENHKILQSVWLKKIYKVGSTARNLTDVTFKLYKSDNTQVTSIKDCADATTTYVNCTTTKDITNGIKTDVNGEIYIQYLPDGQYYFQEFETVPGYKLNEEKLNFTISKGAITKVKAGNKDFENKKRQLTIENKGDDGEPLNNSEFSIYKVVDGNSCPVDGKVTDLAANGNYQKVTNITIKTATNGKATVDISTLPIGKYFIVQENITNVYYIDQPGEVVEFSNNPDVNCFTVTPKDKTDVTPPVFVNKRDSSNSMAALTLTKTLVDDASTAIDGAIIKLVGKKDNSRQTYYGKTDTTGEIGRAHV